MVPCKHTRVHTQTSFLHFSISFFPTVFKWLPFPHHVRAKKTNINKTECYFESKMWNADKNNLICKQKGRWNKRQEKKNGKLKKNDKKKQKKKIGQQQKQTYEQWKNSYLPKWRECIDKTITDELKPIIHNIVEEWIVKTDENKQKNGSQFFNNERTAAFHGEVIKQAVSKIHAVLCFFFCLFFFCIFVLFCMCPRNITVRVCVSNCFASMRVIPGHMFGFFFNSALIWELVIDCVWVFNCQSKIHFFSFQNVWEILTYKIKVFFVTFLFFCFVLWWCWDDRTQGPHYTGV